jgi:dihydrofolate reductase
MGDVSLFIAISLDGYIADPDGGVDWLATYENYGHDEDHGYSKFYSSVSVLAMGRRTYDQILGFGDWPYPGKPTYVFTNSPLSSPPPLVRTIAMEVGEFTRTVMNQNTGRVWLVGGAELAQQFHDNGLIDEYILYIVPVVLGDGIPLFRQSTVPVGLRLIGSRQFNSGLVQLNYRREPAGHPERT